MKKTITALAALTMLATTFAFSAPADAAWHYDHQPWVYGACHFTGTVVGDTSANGWTQGKSVEGHTCHETRVRISYYQNGVQKTSADFYSTGAPSSAYTAAPNSEAIWAYTCGRPINISNMGCGLVWSTA